MNNKENPDSVRVPDPSTVSPGKMVVVLLCIAVILAGVAGAVIFIQTAPKAQKRPPEKMAPLVAVQSVYPETQQVVIQAMGSVVPDKKLTLKSRVAGEIVHLHPEFTEGGVVKAGALLVQVDDQDYKLIVAQKQSAVTDARYALKLELGRQDVARREWALLNGDKPAPAADAELALRKPHLDKARSDLKAAEAELEAARLQLERTRIYAPFNAVIRATTVEKGSHVAAHEPLATLAGTDTYWVSTAVPVDRLNWIEIPGQQQHPGARARIEYNGGAVRQGRVVKLLSDLETDGRMARLIIAVNDPLNLQSAGEQPAMLIGEYVRVQIDGRRIEGAFRLPRSALRDNTRIWVVNSAGKLEIRTVQTLWRDTRTVVLNEGLQSGDRVIVSDLAAPVPGMEVVVDNDQGVPHQPAATDPPGNGNG